jgi:hypothetical protein
MEQTECSETAAQKKLRRRVFTQKKECNMIRLATYSLGDMIVSASKEIAGAARWPEAAFGCFQSVLLLH